MILHHRVERNQHGKVRGMQIHNTRRHLGFEQPDQRHHPRVRFRPDPVSEPHQQRTITGRNELCAHDIESIASGSPPDLCYLNAVSGTTRENYVSSKQT